MAEFGKFDLLCYFEQVDSGVKTLEKAEVQKWREEKKKFFAVLKNNNSEELFRTRKVTNVDFSGTGGCIIISVVKNTRYYVEAKEEKVRYVKGVHFVSHSPKMIENLYTLHEANDALNSKALVTAVYFQKNCSVKTSAITSIDEENKSFETDTGIVYYIQD